MNWSLVARSTAKPVSLVELSVQLRSIRDEDTAFAASPLGAPGEAVVNVAGGVVVVVPPGLVATMRNS